MAYKRTGRNGKKMNIPPNLFLNNVFVIYLIFFIAVGNLFYLLLENNISFVLIFLIIGFLTSFFSKNMIVILTTTLVFTNILKYGIHIRHTEGFKEETNEKETKKSSKDDNTEDDKEHMVPEIDKDLDKYKVDKKNKLIDKKSKTTNEKQIIMDLANLDDDKLDKLNSSLEKQKGLLDNLNSMTPVIKSLDAFTSTIKS